MGRSKQRRRRRAMRARAGSASLDYMLIVGVILPMVALIVWISPRLILLAYEMVLVLVSWPLM